MNRTLAVGLTGLAAWVAVACGPAQPVQRLPPPPTPISTPTAQPPTPISTPTAQPPTPLQELLRIPRMPLPSDIRYGQEQVVPVGHPLRPSIDELNRRLYPAYSGNVEYHSMSPGLLTLVASGVPASGVPNQLIRIRDLREDTNIRGYGLEVPEIGCFAVIPSDAETDGLYGKIVSRYEPGKQVDLVAISPFAHHSAGRFCPQ